MRCILLFIDGNIVTLTSDTKVQLLLKWCQAVCLCYNIEVENFSVSFSDGRVLCYIIRHYHPALLPEDAIYNETTQSMRPDNKSFDEDDIGIHIPNQNRFPFMEIILLFFT